MAGSKGQQQKRKQRGRQGRFVLYAIPVIAIVLVGIVFGLQFYQAPAIKCADAASSSPVMDYKSYISIQIFNKQGNQSTYIVPQNVGIPVPGASWATHQYDSYGTNGRYPLCTDAPPPSSGYSGTTIYVRSSQVINYTLRDFFNVWGQPLGQSATDTTLNSAYVKPTAGFVWQMCIGQGAGATFGNWTYEPLTANKIVQLVYYPQSQDVGCIR